MTWTEPAGSGLSLLAWLGAAALALWIVGAAWRRLPARAVPPTSTRAPLPLGTAHFQEELESLAEDLTERIDAKMQALAELVQLATRRIEELRSLTPGSAERAAASPAHFGKSLGPKKAAPLTAAKPGLTAPRTADRTVPERHSQVYALADSGFDSLRIAAQTGMPRGEIELLLSLRRTQPTHNPVGQILTRLNAAKNQEEPE